MAATHDTVTGRIEHARVELTPGQLAAGVLFLAAIGSLLLFVQEPLVHDSLHDFRHAAGVVCH